MYKAKCPSLGSNLELQGLRKFFCGINWDIGRKYLDDGDGEILKNSAKGESKRQQTKKFRLKRNEIANRRLCTKLIEIKQ